MALSLLSCGQKIAVSQENEKAKVKEIPAAAPEAQPPESKLAVELPKSVDLRPQMKEWGLTPASQGRRNTCSVFVTAGALEFAASKHLGKPTPLSVEYLNWACNQVIGNKTDDRGQFFHHLLKGYEQHGICPSVDMPYEKSFQGELAPSAAASESAKGILGLRLRVHWINPLKKKPGLTDEQLLEMKEVLAKGYPVAAGSGHSLLVVGYEDDLEKNDAAAEAKHPPTGKFLVKDSGKGKYGSVDYATMKEKFGDVFWVEVPGGK